MPKSEPNFWKREISKVRVLTLTRVLYTRSAILAGMKVSTDSANRLGEIVAKGFPLVDEENRGLATANLLRLIAEAVEQTESQGNHTLRESSVQGAQDKLCPIYPFGGRKNGPQRKKR